MSLFLPYARAINYKQGSSISILNLAAVPALFVVGIAPIYWLPGIPMPLLDIFKHGSFVLAAALVIVHFLKTKDVPFACATVFIAFGLASLASVFVFVANGSRSNALTMALEFIYPMIWVVVIAAITRSLGERIIARVQIALSITSLAALYIFLAGRGLGPDFRLPLEGLNLLEENIDGFMRASASSVGFAYGRTGWGLGAGSALILLGSLLVSQRRAALGLTVFLFAIVSLSALGARGSTLAALGAVSIAVIGLKHFGRFRLLLYLLGAAVAVLSFRWFANAGLVSDRFFRTTSSGSLFERVDALTTGRLTTWVHGIETFVQNPLIGAGPKAAFVTKWTGEQNTVHNVWIKLAAEGGLIVLIPAVTIAIWAFGTTWRAAAFRPLLVFVGVLSFVEPSVVFGTFGNNTVFWTAVGIAMATHRPHTASTKLYIRWRVT